jgi:hypothetical protein
MTLSAEPLESLAVAEPPRPLTPAARRRSWNEPKVRAWWLAALAMLLLAAWLLIEQISLAREARYRVAHWKRINSALIEVIGDSSRKSYRVPPDQIVVFDVKLSYADPDAKPDAPRQEVKGRLAAQTEPLSPGQSIPILVDPTDPHHWTDRVTPQPLFEQLLAPVLVAPLPIIFALVAWLQRQRILTLWRDGTLRQGTVVGRKHSAVAPRSDILRCQVEGAPDNRLLQVAVPRAAFAFQPDDPIALITPQEKPDRAIAAMLYE